MYYGLGYDINLRTKEDFMLLMMKNKRNFFIN